MGKLPVQCIISITVSLGPFAQYTLMQAWHALFPLVYHILRICILSGECALAAGVFWLPSGARLSAVNAETGMRRYNARSAVNIP